jgi:shikimate dehydrogenase
MSKRQFGLLGKGIAYSFSKKYFTEYFTMGNCDACTYENFDVQTIAVFPSIISSNPDLKGLNVTIPYKESVIPYLDKLSQSAAQIEAVNVIRFTRKGKLKGYNSDYYGFMKSIQPLLLTHHKKALVLGTGGAAKAVAFALDRLGLSYTYVSREAREGMLDYAAITATTFEEYHVVINCTPLGTSPNTEAFPPIPYAYFTEKHIAFDLVYNPEETQFLKKAKANGAVIKNGYEMLVFQAEKAWKIWNK